MKKILTLFLVAVFGLFFATLAPKPAQAELDADKLAADIDEFFNAGAQGYLVWQYGGDSSRTMTEDQYSFFLDTPDGDAICETLKQKADEWGPQGKFIGVNINNLGAVEFADGTATGHLTRLKNQCGVSVVRIFAKVELVPGVLNALSAAQSAGVQIIVAIGDYSNGGGGIPQGGGGNALGWYSTGYTQPDAQGVTYKTLAADVAAAAGGNPALWGFELANEPHCSGNGSLEALTAYREWGRDIGGILGQGSSRVGYGQMASQNTTRCDSPGPEDYKFTNDIPQMTVASAHYYSNEEKANALAALSQALALGKTFYIGEAPPGGDRLDGGSEPPAGSIPGSGYDLDNYPTYGEEDPALDEWRYFIHPIKGLLDTDGTERSPESISADLVAQGYEPHCATPEYKISPEYKIKDKIDRFVELYPGGVTTAIPPEEPLLALSSEVLDYSVAESPIFRDVDTDNTRFLTSSIEEFWGFQDVYEEDPTRSELSSAPVNSLLNDEQYCVQAWRTLVRQELMCEQLADPGSCALFARKIPGTGYTVKTLLTDMKNFSIATKKLFPDSDYPLYRDDISNGVNCSVLFNGTSRDDEWKKLREGLLQTPLHIDRGYRLAFLVMSVETRFVDETFTDPSRFFNFFEIDSPNDEPRDTILAIAFKIPDIATNKGGLPGEEATNIYYDDPLFVTRQTLVPAEKTALIKGEADARRLALLENVKIKNTSAQTTDDEIFCMVGAYKSLQAGPACQDELGKALVDIINAQPPDCGSLEFEDVAQISDPAYVIPPPTLDPSRIYLDELGSKLLYNLFIDPTHLDKRGIERNPQVAENTPNAPYLRSIFNPTASNWPPDEDWRPLNFYLVYPVGYELQEIENVFKGTFFNVDQLAALEQDDELRERFPILNDRSGLQGGSVSKIYADPDLPGCPFISVEEMRLYPPALIPPACYDTWEIKIESDQQSATVLGARLGFWMRTIQKGLNRYFSAPYAYLQSCETTEQFLLGQCSGGDFNQTSGDTSAFACQYFENQEVYVPTLSEMDQAVCTAALAGGLNEEEQQTLYGMMKIEAGPMLDAAAARERGGPDTMMCSEMINACGAVGPMQIIQGVCVTDQCGSSNAGAASQLERPDDICELGPALKWSVDKINSERSYVQGLVDQSTRDGRPLTQAEKEKQALYIVAGRFNGRPESDLVKYACEGAPEVMGCNGLNYCECAVDGWDFSCN